MTLDQLLTSPSGRIGRRDYWKALAVITLMVAVSAAAFRIHDGTICAMDPATGRGTAYFAAMALTVLLVGWMGFAYVAKRLHDVGLSGFLGLVVVAPYVAVPAVTRLAICPLKDLPADGLIERLAALTPALAVGGVALLALMLQLYLGIQRGMPGRNRHGADPASDARKPLDAGARGQ